MSKPHATTPATPKNLPVEPPTHEEEALDEALEETFPSSDPVAVSITKDAPPKR